MTTVIDILLHYGKNYAVSKYFSDLKYNLLLCEKGWYWESHQIPLCGLAVYHVYVEEGHSLLALP